MKIIQQDIGYYTTTLSKTFWFDTNQYLFSTCFTFWHIKCTCALYFSQKEEVVWLHFFSIPILYTLKLLAKPPKNSPLNVWKVEIH